VSDPAVHDTSGADLREPLREALRGVRGLLLDLDGVIVSAERLVSGSAEAIAELDRRAIPFRVVTNTSMVSRRTLAAMGERLGVAIPAERYHSALSISALHTAERYPGEPLYVLASPDARQEFDGQRLLTHEEAAEPNARAAAVVIGDSPADATWDNLNRAFRLVRNGAQLIGMHKNRWWLTPEGPTLDSGAFVAGLEFAAGVRATIVGKPSAAFFAHAARDLAAEVGGRVRRADLAMVGDDVWSDALAAQRAGLRGILVLTGKHGHEDVVAAAARRRGGGAPNGVAASLADVVAALD
jgi:HAD superfamily hydrolase (TIGR01458 family)